MGDLSRNFSLDEFDCNDGTPVPKIYIPHVRDLVTLILQPVRDAAVAEYGSRIISYSISSGFRTPEHNAKQDGAADDSFHLYGMADDGHLVGIPIDAHYRLVIRLRAQGIIPPCGIGYYPKSKVPFIHTDLGPWRDWPPLGAGSDQK